MAQLSRLVLANFRNHAALDLDLSGARLLVFTGPNGVGKTNLLEAISLLVPGRGLRAARIADIARRVAGAPAADGFTVRGEFAEAAGPFAIGAFTQPGVARRQFRLDGDVPESQAEIAARLALLWLTPQMDMLFQEPASGRRRFLDRLAQALEPGHARQLAAHDQLQAERLRLLASPAPDPIWLTALEDRIARRAVAITAMRDELVRQLNAALAETLPAFPRARLALHCAIATALVAERAVAVEAWLRAAQAAARGRDAEERSATYGVQRADMQLLDAQSGLSAERASTGQRKAMLVSVLLGQAAMLTRLRGAAPILLLDEPLVHLDAQRRAALAASLTALPCQALLTGTDPEAFADFQGAHHHRLAAPPGLA